GEWGMGNENHRNAANPSSIPHSPFPIPHFKEEPLADFSRAESRAAMQEALQQVAGQLGKTYPLVINGRDIALPATVDSTTPWHRRRAVGRCVRGTPELAREAVGAAPAAFPAWRATEPAKRAQYLFDAADVMRRRRYELAAWQVYECGKPWREADADVAET